MVIQNKNIIVVILKQLDKYIVSFYKYFYEQFKIDVFFISDSNIEGCKFYNDKLCTDNKIRNLTLSLRKKITAWDRCFYFLKTQKINYDFVWIIEDDVYIKNPDFLYKLIKKYKNKHYHLLTNHIISHEKFRNWPNWYVLAKHEFKSKYFSFNCFCRLSKNLVDLSCKYMEKNYDKNISFFHEILFINICIKNNLKYSSFEEKKDSLLIRWRPFINKQEIEKNYKIYHPVKDINLKDEYLIKHL